MVNIDTENVNICKYLPQQTQFYPYFHFPQNTANGCTCFSIFAFLANLGRWFSPSSRLSLFLKLTKIFLAKWKIPSDLVMARQARKMEEEDCKLEKCVKKGIKRSISTHRTFPCHRTCCFLMTKLSRCQSNLTTVTRTCQTTCQV